MTSRRAEQPKSRRSRSGASAPRQLLLSADRSTLLFGLLLLGFVAVAYGPSLGMTFIGDDYVFLDKTRTLRFLDVWSFQNTNFGWYRPWSRELHFWTLQHLVGAQPFAFRIASLILWLGTLLTYALLVSSLASRRTALIATAGVASLALWGAPLLWISGCQDLWMLAFGTLALLLIVRGKPGLALLPFAGALLSKETAVVLPLIAGGYWLIVAREPWGRVARRLAPFAVLALAWLVVHPVLLRRLASGSSPGFSGEPSLPVLEVLLRSGLSLVNADRALHPVAADAFSWTRTLLSSVLLVLAVVVALLVPNDAGPSEPAGHAGRVRRAVFAFGLFWCAAAWIPLFMRSIGWHAYYGSLGTFGAWLALATLLTERRTLTIALFIGLALLRGKSSATRSWDWGSEWYQRRAGNLLAVIRTQLSSMHPRLPHHARVYFEGIPNNIGLVAGESPAIRVWYRDNTLQAGFYSYYRPRSIGEPDGPDLFFGFDSTRGLVPVLLGPENIASAIRFDPNWERRHRSVAVLLLKKGNPGQAALEFEKISMLERRHDASMFAAVCWEQLGNGPRAESLYAAVRVRSGLGVHEIEQWAAMLRATLPRSPSRAGRPRRVRVQGRRQRLLLTRKLVPEVGVEPTLGLSQTGF